MSRVILTLASYTKRMENSIMPQLPKDPVMLLSFTNTQLRDHYSSLTEFCKAYIVDEHIITEKLRSIDYEYDKNENRFI